MENNKKTEKTSRKLTTVEIIKKVLNGKSIPTGNGNDDIEARKKIISDFYYEWKKNNPAQKLYNYNLKEDINIRHVSVIETMEHGSKNYLSTLAVLQLDTILRLAKKVRIVNTKPNNANQRPFEKMIKMEYNLVGLGRVSLTVGIKRSNKEKVQYCITVIRT